MLAWLARWFQSALKYGVPVVFLVFVGATIYEHYHPWPSANLALPVASHQTRILVGFVIYRSDTHSDFTLDYVVFPDVLTKPAIYTLQQKNGGAVTVDVEPYGAVVALVAVLGLSGASIVAWLKSRSRGVT